MVKPIINALRILVCMFGVAPFIAAHAEMTIKITEGTESKVPIAVAPFTMTSGEPSVELDMAAVITADLNRSGFFNALGQSEMLTRPTDISDVRFRNWQVLGQDFLVIGQLSTIGKEFVVQFQLLDVYKEDQLAGYRLTVKNQDLRRAAHQISDIVYEKLTGKKGVFNTRVAFVSTHTDNQQKKRYMLQVADADGYNPVSIASSVEPLMSPAWSPDGKKLAYVSFENRKSAIYIQTLNTGKRFKVAAYKGINGAPAWSPDGKKLALTLSKDGSPDIYVLNLASQRLQKLTKSFSIDTEPAWSPDGKFLVFTSDRGGRPQLYKVSATGGTVLRLTFSGEYNGSAVFSADGKQLAMVHANRGDYRIAVMDLQSKQVNVLTDGPLDESPGFAPNGSMIIYASRKGNEGILAAVSADGKSQQKLIFNRGEVREPAWSPVN